MSKKLKEGKGKVKSGLKVEGGVELGFEDHSAELGNLGNSVSESSTLQEDSTNSEAKSEVSNLIAVSQKSLQKSGKLLAKFPTAKQPVKKAVPKNTKSTGKSGKQAKKILAQPTSKLLGENPPESSQCPLLHPPCSKSELCHCPR